MIRLPLALVFLLALLVGRAAEAADTQPYFLSIKNEKTFMREGPGDNHRIKWIYHRKGLPVRGQRTHTNARTRKGPAKPIAGKKK